MPRFVWLSFFVATTVVASLTVPSNAFIRVQGTKFVNENCSDFAFVGANVWQVVEAQAGIFNEQANGTNPAEYLFQTAAANNITVIRMFAEGTTNNLTLQTGPHSYNQSALKALDQTVAMAGKHGIKLTLILGDTWGTPESIAQFASWSNTSVHNFFLDSQAINLYKDHISYMVNRTNTVTGVKYSEDPTIFSWNVLNEPRFFYNYSKCHDDPQFCRNKLYSWIKETSSHLKSIDSNHMVSIGYEGFFAPNSQYSKANPSGGWVKYTGQDFENDTALSTIDYAEIHLWVDNWDVAGNNGFIKTWVNDHEKAAQKLGKPLVMEEFGKNTTNPFNEQLKDQQVRNQTFSTVMSYLTDSLNSGGILRGALYWMWDPVIQSTNSPGYEKYGQDQVPVNGSTFHNIIVPAANKAASKDSTVQGCSSNSTSSAGRKLRWV